MKSWGGISHKIRDFYPTPPDEDATLNQMLKNLANVTDKYEAAIAMQPEAARPFSKHANKQLDQNDNNKNCNPYTSANQAASENQNEDEDDYESDNIEDRDIDNLKKLHQSASAYQQPR